MSKAIFFPLVFLICAALPAAASAVGNRPVDVWRYYHFDGIAFTPGPSTDGSAFVAVREKVRPVVLTTQTSPTEQTRLPNGEGVLAGICYLQSSGGKLVAGSGFK